MAERDTKQYSVEEYFSIDNQSDIRNEYHNGVIVSLAGGTKNHSIISNNINTHINNHLIAKELGCIAFNGDLKVYVDKANAYVYPDGMVVCGEIETHSEDEESVVNPVLIVEVLSKSTGNYDRGDKFHKYCVLPSFREYVLIDQYKPVVDVLYKADEKYWKMVTIIGLDKSIYLNSIDAYIKMEDIYRNALSLGDGSLSLNF